METLTIPICNDCGSLLTAKEVEVCHEYKTDPFGSDAVCSVCWGEKFQETDWKDAVIDELAMIELKEWPVELRGHGPNTDELMQEVYQFAAGTLIEKLRRIL